MSRFSVIVSLAALAPVTAFAVEPKPGESNDEVVTFTGEERLFKGLEQAYGLDLWEEGVGIYAKADTSSDLSFIMEGLSSLEWPAILDNSWDQTEKGGTFTLTNKAKVWIEITGEILGVKLGYEVWREEVDWTQTFELRSLLLEGTRQGKTAVLTAEGKDLVSFEEELEISADFLTITVAGAVRPVLQATVTAEAIEVGNGSVTSTSDTTTVPKPTVNDGFAEFDATWKGSLSGKMGLRVVPTVTVQVDRFSFGPLSYPLDIAIFTDTVPLESAPSKVTHDLPAGQAGSRTLDFGQVVVGDSVTREFTLKNLGNVELKGTSRVEGEGFVMPAEAVLVARTNGGAATTQTFEVDFLPEGVGSFTGTLVFETNDPVNPEIRVPMAGAGVNPPDDNDGDPNDTDDGDGLISQPGRGCGCDNTSPVGLGVAGLFGLLAVLRRRR